MPMLFSHVCIHNDNIYPIIFVIDPTDAGHSCQQMKGVLNEWNVFFGEVNRMFFQRFTSLPPTVFLNIWTGNISVSLSAS